jgi:hypothetical protein
VGEVGGAAEWLSITVTDTRFVLRTKRLTRDLIDIRLGRDYFDKAGSCFKSPTSSASIGQKEQSYMEVCDGPTAYGSQKAILGHSSIGVGKLATQGDLTSPTIIREKTTINSLAIARPFGDLAEDVLLGEQEVQSVPLGRRRPLTSLVSVLRRRLLMARNNPKALTQTTRYIG